MNMQKNAKIMAYSLMNFHKVRTHGPATEMKQDIPSVPEVSISQ